MAPRLVAHTEIGNYQVKNTEKAGTIATSKLPKKMEKGVMRLIEIEHLDLMPNDRAKARAIQNALYVLSNTPPPRKVRKKKCA